MAWWTNNLPKDRWLCLPGPFRAMGNLHTNS